MPLMKAQRFLFLAFLPFAYPAAQTAIRDYKLELPNQTMEIEAVCKIGEDETQCWTPKGQLDKEATREFHRVLEANADKGSGYDMALGRKNRFLMLKYTPRLGNIWFGYSSSFENASGADFQTFVSFLPPKPNASGYREYVLGHFPAKVTHGELGYQLVCFESKWVKIPFRTGKFEVGNSTYEITKIEEQNHDSVLTVRPIHIANPDEVLMIHPANNLGDPYDRVELETGEPVSRTTVNRDEMNAYMDMKKGKPYKVAKRGSVTWIQLAAANLPKGGTRTTPINLPPSKIQKLSIQWGHKSSYRFGPIALDPIP